MLGSRFTELHSGLRAYTRRCLLELPILRYSDDFAFDSQLMVDAVTTGQRVVEVPIETRYTKDSSSISVGRSLRYVAHSLDYCGRRTATRGRRGRRSAVTFSGERQRRPPASAAVRRAHVRALRLHRGSAAVSGQRHRRGIGQRVLMHQRRPRPPRRHRPLPGLRHDQLAAARHAANGSSRTTSDGGRAVPVRGAGRRELFRLGDRPAGRLPAARPPVARGGVERRPVPVGGERRGLGGEGRRAQPVGRRDRAAIVRRRPRTGDRRDARRRAGQSRRRGHARRARAPGRPARHASAGCAGSSTTRGSWRCPR